MDFRLKLKNYYILIFVLIAFLIRFFGIWFDLPHVYTTEEYKVLNYALKMAATKDPNPHFFNYPSLYLYFTVLVSGLYFLIARILGIYSSVQDFANSYILNPTPLYLIMRFLSSLWSTGIVIMTYFIGRRLYNRRVGIMAMIMMIFIPSILISSHEIRPSMPEVFFVMLSFYFLMEYYYNMKTIDIYIAAALLGVAISIFYNAFPLAVLFPVIYFLKNKKITFLDYRLYAMIGIIVLFFVIGTPYSVLDFNSFLKDMSVHSQGAFTSLRTGVPRIFNEILFMGVVNIKLPFIGLVVLVGMLNAVLEKKNEGIILIAAVVVFAIPAAMYHLPAIGYMFAAVPLLLIMGAKVMDRLLENKYGYMIYVLYLVCLLPSVIECVQIDKLYVMGDTRTVAKNWIENNIPGGSKVLIDMYPHSPPLKETKEQLKSLYERAVQLNHYKKEYLKLQMEAPEVLKSRYWIYRILRKPDEVSGTIEYVKEAQKVQDSIDTSIGFESLKEKVEYIALNSWDQQGVFDSNDETLKKFYQTIQQKCKLLRIFSTKENNIRGPEIYVYKI